MNLRLRSSRFLLLFVTICAAIPTIADAGSGRGSECFRIRDAGRPDADQWRDLTAGLPSGCRLRTRAALLCVAAGEDARTAAAATASGLTSEQLCYPIRCPRDRTGTDITGDSAIEIDDGFGARVLERRGASLLCTPAAISPAGTRGDDDGGSGARRLFGSAERAIVLRKCGDYSGDGVITASDALGVLRTAVGTATCLPCVCDVDASGTAAAGDALRVLKNAVGQGSELSCEPDGKAVSWTGAGDGISWHLPANWSLQTRIPNLCDDVSIESAGNTIVHSQGSDGVLRLHSSRSVDLSGGALQVRDSVFVGATLRMVSATLKGGVVLGSDEIAPAAAMPRAVAPDMVFTPNGGVLDGVTMAAGMNLSANSANVRIRNNLTLDGIASIGAGASLRFEGGTQMLQGSGEVAFNGASSKSIIVDFGTSLQIGPEMTVRGATGTVGSSGMLVNAGLIDSDLPGAITVTSAQGWTNQGSVRGRGGGDVRLAGIWTNNASIDIADGGVLTLDGTWTNAGTITSQASTVNLDGTFSLASLGNLSRSGGDVNVTGTFQNTTNLTLNSTTGNWDLVGGTILGGTVSGTEGAELVMTNGGGVLDGVTMATGMNLSANSANVRVRNNLTLEGTASMGAGSILRFEGGNQTLQGNAEVVFNGASTKTILVDSGTSLAIAADTTVRGATGTVGSTGALVNHGLIDSDLPGLITVTSTQGWTNEATVRGRSGGGLRLAGMWTNNESVGIADGGVLTLDGTWTNAGTITSVASTVNLDGTFSLATLGNFSRSGGDVNVTGTFQNTTNLTLDSTTGSWDLVGGTILGGTVTGTGGAELVMTNGGGVLDGVTMATGMNLSANSANVRIRNNLTLEGTASMGAGSLIRFEGGNQTLQGNGEVSFNGASSKTIIVDSGTTLAIGADMIVRGATGTVGSTGALVNHGLIDSDLPGVITINSTQGWTNQATVRGRGGGSLTLLGMWTNNASIDMADGGVLKLDGTWTNAGTITSVASTVTLDGAFSLASLGNFSRSGGDVNVAGTFNNATNLTLNSTTGSWDLLGGTILGGTVTGTDGAELVMTTSGGVLDGVTMATGMNLSANSANVRVLNNLTLEGTASMGSGASIRFQGGSQMLQGSGEISFNGPSGKTIIVDSGTTLRIGADMILRGATGTIGSSGVLINDGLIDSDQPGTLTVASSQGGWTNNGTLRGSGGNLHTTGIGTNSGTIHLNPGQTLTASTGFTQDGAGTLEIDISAPATFGKTTITGAATLAGTLEIALTNGFVPNLGATFQIMTFGSHAGDFRTVTGLGIGGGKRFERTTTATAMTLEVVPE